MSKRNKIIYWIATLWLALGMTSTGIIQLLKMDTAGATAPPGADGIKLLGYPVFFLTILGVWKLLGVVAILAPRYPLVKEWAYAGFFFLTTGAIATHITLGHPVTESLPALLLVLTVVSWYFRPAGRKIVVS